MYWESERDLIVSILTREVVGGKQSQDLFSTRNVRWREGTTLMVKFGDYNQSGHMPILDFEYNEEGSTVF